MRNRKTFLVAALAVTLAAREAGADVPVHLKTSFTYSTDGGSTGRLPPGYFLDEQAWQERDLEMRRLQDQEKRLAAENRSLRESAATPSLTVAVIAATVGLLAGGAIVAWQLK